MKKVMLLFLVLGLPSGILAEAAVPGIFHRSPAPTALYVIERKGLPNADWHLAAVIQGMVSRESPEIYLVDQESGTQGDEVLLDYYVKAYGIRELGEITAAEALGKYAGRFKGYAVFSFEEDWTVNAADTYCSIQDCLPVSAEQEGLAQKVGLKKVEDFRGRWKNAEESMAWSLRELFPKCSKKTVASLSPRMHTCRDYLFAHRIYTFYFTARGRDYLSLRKLLRALPENIPCLGYIARSGVEEWIVEYTLAETSKFMVPTDLVPNLTVHSGIPIKPLPELHQWTAAPDLAGKLGVVFAMTDGDNLFAQAEHYLRPDWWLTPDRGQIKVAWSVAPELYELAPGIMRYYYETRTPNDFFVALSGAGYTFTSALKNQEYFKTISREYLRLTGLDVLWTLDPPLYFPVSKWALGKVLGPPMGDDDYLKGVLAGYAAPLHFQNWWQAPGYPPLLYCQTNYYVPIDSLVNTIKSEAAHVPRRGKLVFYGLNVWAISYQDLLSIQRRLLPRPDIVFISPQEAFAVIEKWQNN